MQLVYRLLQSNLSHTLNVADGSAEGEVLNHQVDTLVLVILILISMDLALHVKGANFTRNTENFLPFF